MIPLVELRSTHAPITSKVAVFFPVDEVYSIQLYVIKFVSYLWQVCGFPCYVRSIGIPVSSNHKTDCHDTVTEI